jgi:hypothetical protein
MDTLVAKNLALGTLFDAASAADVGVGNAPGEVVHMTDAERLGPGRTQMFHLEGWANFV